MGPMEAVQLDRSCSTSDHRRAKGPQCIGIHGHAKLLLRLVKPVSEHRHFG